MAKSCRDMLMRGCLCGVLVILLVSCTSMKQSLHLEKVEQKMGAYAEARYRKAMMYMEDSRFELAQEQFAIVAVTAASPSLRQLGIDGYSKADRAIALRR